MGHSIVDALHGVTGFVKRLVGLGAQGAFTKLPILLRLIVDDEYRALVAGVPRRGPETAWDGNRRSAPASAAVAGSVWQRTIEQCRVQQMVSDAVAGDLVRAFELDVS